ncbi:hypothetical protein AcV5_004903 [Taiwanofungus camphoratus]|nr:hypothetical protein AcW2_000507 [Antrodia cinnamomea]KAI0936872.1 hypothetical protein AcV5_004903 [Antrodia cinnamomea]
MATFHRGYLHPFQDGRHFLYGVGETPRTLTELAMCQCSDFIRSKSRWWQLHEHHDIRQKWAKEAAEIVWIVQASCGSLEVTLSKKQIQYVLDELSGYAALRDEHHRWKVVSTSLVRNSLTL